MTVNNSDYINRISGLRRFAVAITILNVLGHTFFGFEQSLAQPLVALLTTYITELLLEVVCALSERRAPRFIGGLVRLIDFLLPAHISGLAVAMLLYANDRLWVVSFAAAAAIASKYLFRAPIGKGVRHYFNPSNFGITITLLLFSWVGIAPPYHFTENLDRVGDWLLPSIIIVSGSFLNARFTKRLPLIAAWLVFFFFQALARHLFFDASLNAALLPMTGVSFILYTFYMVTDPATTPQGKWAQIAFGASVAIAYGMLMVTHIVFGLFFALTLVCFLRGIGLHAIAWAGSKAKNKVTSARTPVVVTEG